MIKPKAQIRVFTPAITLLGEVDIYEDLYFTRGWNKPGQFQLKINWNITDQSGLLRYASLFEENNIIMVNGDAKKTGIIVEVKKSIDEGGKGSQIVTITGYQLAYIFNWRKCDVPTSDDYYTLNSDAETVMKTAISDQAGPTATNTKRAFSQLEIATNQNRGSNYLLKSNFKNLLDELNACSVATQIGYGIELDVENKKFVFDCYVGTNRVVGQNPNAIFATDYDTLKSSNVTKSSVQYRNLCTVASKGQGALRTIVDVFLDIEPEDTARRETFVSGNDLETTPDLTAKGEQQLNQLQYQTQIEAEGLTYSPLVYGIDYDLGDYVTIRSYDVEQNVQIIEVKESWSTNNYDISLIFDKSLPQFPSQTVQAINNIQNTVNNLGSPVLTNPSGSNYIRKYDDGTMEQWVQVAFSGNINTASGSLFESAEVVLGNWPEAFNVAPFSYNVYVQTSSSDIWVSTRSTGPSSTAMSRIKLLRPTSTTGVTGTIYVYGFGTWR